MHDSSQWAGSSYEQYVHRLQPVIVARVTKVDANANFSEGEQGTHASRLRGNGAVAARWLRLLQFCSRVYYFGRVKLCLSRILFKELHPVMCTAVVGKPLFSFARCSRLYSDGTAILKSSLRNMPKQKRKKLPVNCKAMFYVA